jgi:hypothetical protein
MKVKVSYTIEVDPKLVKFYLEDLQSGETIREFVKSYCESVAHICMDETLLPLQKYLDSERRNKI